MPDNGNGIFKYLSCLQEVCGIFVELHLHKLVHKLVRGLVRPGHRPCRRRRPKERGSGNSEAGGEGSDAGAEHQLQEPVCESMAGVCTFVPEGL